jgi:hypothetical protein
MHMLEFVIDAAHKLLRSDDCNGSKGVIFYMLSHCNEENRRDEGWPHVR